MWPTYLPIWYECKYPIVTEFNHPGTCVCKIIFSANSKVYSQWIEFIVLNFINQWGHSWLSLKTATPKIAKKHRHNYLPPTAFIGLLEVSWAQVLITSPIFIISRPLWRKRFGQFADLEHVCSDNAQRNRHKHSPKEVDFCWISILKTLNNLKSRGVILRWHLKT